MTWIFSLTDVRSQETHSENCAEWQQAFDSMVAFIDLVRPASIRSLKTVCENIPIEKSASFTDGQFAFSLSPENG